MKGFNVSGNTNRPVVKDVHAFFEIYGEPCNNCERYTDGAFCEMGHRQRRAAIETGHIPELTYRRQQGCPDWTILTSKTDAWWNEEPIAPHSSVYGGVKTDILA